MSGAAEKRACGGSPPASIGRVVGAGSLGGAIAGGAAGLIDGLWSWAPIGQFLGGFAGKLQLLAFLAAGHALAGALLGAGLALGALYFSRATRLGDLLRAGLEAHRRARARDPRGALAGLSLAIAAVPVFSGALGLAYALAYRGLAERKHIGLVLAVAMGIALVAAAAAALASFALARPIEAGLRRLARSRRFARPLSSPAAPAVAAALLLFGAGAAAAALTRETLGLLHLRPIQVALLGLSLHAPSWRLGADLWRALARRAPGARAAALAGGSLLCAITILGAGGPESVRKAAHAYSGLGGPLTRLYQKLGDLDRDGYSRFLGGGDCDDWNSRVHPGAPEIPDDGIDNNCVGGDATTGRSPDEVAFTDVPASVPEDTSVLLITIDTLRSDHLGAYGYSRDTSPVLDAIAEEGALFENAWAHAPSTRYSMPAIVTGKHPLQVAYDHSIQGWPGLSEKNTTIAEILKAQGFTTGAILNYWYFDPHRRMDQGFDHYDNSNKRLHRSVPGEGPAETQGSSSEEQTDKAIDYVRSHRDERFFLWVHYYDPHYRYERHPGMPDFGDREIDVYDQEIRYTDHHIGRLVDELEELGLWDRTIVAITGDHGEGFGEHGIELHGYHLYAAQTKVPIIFRVPGLEPRRVAMPAGHVDILPTVANLAGAAPTSEMRGRSLLGVLSGAEDPDRDRWVFQQLSYEDNNEYRGAANKLCHVLYNISPNTSWELYRIDRDPLERRDIIDDPGACEGAREVLEAWYDQSEIPPGAAEALLSGRPEVSEPVAVSFGDGIRLLDVDLPDRPLGRGESFEMTYTFEARGRTGEGWKIFAHFESDRGGRFLGDHRPARPFSWWRPGQHIRYAREVTVPRSARPGTYQLWTGVFRGAERLPARSERVPVRDDRARVGTITVR